MKSRRVGLQNKSSMSIPLSKVQAVAHALQIQVDRDFAPEWGAHAQLVAFDHGEAVPAGVWLMSIVDRPVGGLGIHLDQSHHPYAQIKDTSDWSVTASHELLEMLVDPYGHRFVHAPSIAPNANGHNVQYLVEVGDPCEIWSYSINGIAVSDFVTQEYYNPHAPSGTSLDHLSRLSQPYEVPAGCYLSWIDPTDGHWHQKQTDGAFIRSQRPANPKSNPRDDRDRAFGEDPDTILARHDLPAIRARYAK